MTVGSPTSPTAQKESWEGPRLPEGRGPGRCPSGTWAGCTGVGELSLVTAGFSPPPTASKGEFYDPPPIHHYLYTAITMQQQINQALYYIELLLELLMVYYKLWYICQCHCLSVFLQGIQQYQQVAGDRWNARPKRQRSLKNGHPHQSYHKSKSRDVWIHVNKSTNQILWNMTDILHVT